jgi:hypothetical protein
MKKQIHLLFQLIIVCAALAGVVLQIIFQKGPNSGLNLLSYFTIQSNLVVALALSLNIYYRTNPPGWLAVLKSGAAIWILVTGLVFHFLLSQVYHPVGILMFANILLHYIVPAGAQINWLIFEVKGTYRHKFTFIWIAYPTLYAFISLLRAKIDGFYPYWFLNPIKNYPDGAGSFVNVLIVIALLALVFSIIGNLIVLIDRRLRK